jgi:para-nitrobenzyl esterase
MMSYWAEFAYNGDPGKGRRGDLIRWETWNNLENENKFLIFDTPQDGGVRMNKEALSYEVLVERLLLDNRIPDDSMRCILLQKAAEADWMIDNTIMNSGLCNELN